MLGISFYPNQTGPDRQQQGPTPDSAVQQAIQMISLRVPRFAGQGAIAPPPLLQRPPGAPLPPQPGTPEWDELMRRLREGIGAAPRQPLQPSPPGQPPSPPAPTPWPRVTPIQPGEPGPSRPEVPSKPLPDGRFPFAAMFDHVGSRLY